MNAKFLEVAKLFWVSVVAILFYALLSGGGHSAGQSCGVKDQPSEAILD